MTKPTLPARSAELGEALRAVWRHLSEQINAPITASDESFCRFGDGLRHVLVVAGIAERLRRRFDDLIEALRQGADASDAALYSAVGKLEAVLDDFADSYHEVASLHTAADDVEWQQLLAAVYRLRLIRIRDFLQEMSWMLIDPAAAESRMSRSTDSYTLSLNLNLDCPLETSRLTELMGDDRERLQRVREYMA